MKLLWKICPDTPPLIRDDLPRFLTECDRPTRVELEKDPALPAGSWRRRVDWEGDVRVVRLAAGDPSSLGLAAYEFLEDLGFYFEISGPVIPSDIGWKRLSLGERVGRAPLRRRGIRQHVNFTMDLSGYPLEEAREYIRNLARMGFNHITFHSYTGQWFEVRLPNRTVWAGDFFYGVRHPLPDDPFLRRRIRNRSVFCIPEIEPFFEDKEERSRRAMAWLRAVMQEARRSGLFVQFSFEPYTFPNEEEALAACEAIRASYPEIQCLELITRETGGWGKADSLEEIRQAAREAFGSEAEQEPALAESASECPRDLSTYLRDLGYVLKITRRLRERWSRDAKSPEVACGFYNSVPSHGRLSLSLMRRAVPDVETWTVLASHGSRGVARNLRESGLTEADARHLMVYSWIEFDGLMYLQQNPVHGLRQLIEEMDQSVGLGTLKGMAFNHWRTAENVTCARYAAEATRQGPLAERPFYHRRAEILGIGHPDLYAASMMIIDDADGRATLDLPNVGFCAMWGGDRIGTLRWQLFDIAQRVEEEYAHARLLLGRCAAQTTSEAGRRHLALLDNRLLCTEHYLRAIKRAAALTPLCWNREPSELSVREREQVNAICATALADLDRYARLLAECLPDRGAEGTLVSFLINLPDHLKRIQKTYGGGGLTPQAQPAQSPTEGPPLPIVA